MVEEDLTDLLDDAGHVQQVTHRCLQCGEVIDPVILDNRQGLMSRTAEERIEPKAVTFSRA